MSKKRSSGGKRRAFARIRRQLNALGFCVLPGKRGRPKKPSANVQNRLAKIERDLIWLGEPDRANSKLARDLLEPEVSELELMQVLLKEPEHFRKYWRMSERAFRRDVAAIQKKIWGPKKD